MITIEDFQKIELRLGRILTAEDFPEAKIPAYKLLIDFGAFGQKRSSARITDLYTKEDLIGRFIICATNLPPRQVGPFISEVLTTGFYRDEKTVVLATADGDAPLGSRLA